MKIAFERMKLVLEPSGAASLAALLDGGVDVAGKTVLVIATGGNVSLADFMKHVEPCLKPISSSSAPARPARPWPTACRRTASTRVIVIEYRRHRSRAADPDAVGAVDPDEHEPLRLGLCQRAGAASRRPRAGHAARQGDRRLVLDQRHGLCARPCARLRPLGRSKARPAGRFADVLPYFKRMENADGGEDGWRGTDGPLHVQRGPAPQPALRAPSSRPAARPVSRLTDDYNGSKQEGFGRDGADHPSAAAAGRPPTPI